jgi:phi LC3 family holin
MRINWKQRFRNYGWTLTFMLGLVAMFYQLVKVYEAAKSGLPPQELLEETAKMLATLLVNLGILADPTTKGFNDSARAMSYGVPTDKLNTSEIEKGLKNAEVLDNGEKRADS